MILEMFYALVKANQLSKLDLLCQRGIGRHVNCSIPSPPKKTKSLQIILRNIAYSVKTSDQSNLKYRFQSLKIN